MRRTALIPFSVRVSVPGDLKILIGSKAPNHSATPSNSHSTERLPLRSRFVKTWKISDIVASTPRNTLSKPQNPWTLISFAQIIVYDVGMFRSIACDLPGHENRKLSQSSNDYIVRQLKISSCVVLRRNVGAKLQGRLCRTRPSWSASHVSWREMERALPRAARMERNASWREVGRCHCSFTVWENSSLPLASVIFWPVNGPHSLPT